MISKSTFQNLFTSWFVFLASFGFEKHLKTLWQRLEVLESNYHQHTQLKIHNSILLLILLQMTIFLLFSPTLNGCIFWLQFPNYAIQIAMSPETHLVSEYPHFYRLIFKYSSYFFRFSEKNGVENILKLDL